MFFGKKAVSEMGQLFCFGLAPTPLQRRAGNFIIMKLDFDYHISAPLSFGEGLGVRFIKAYFSIKQMMY